MKALTLFQPHASLVAAGIKWLETRSWAVDYRGELAITASANYPRAQRELAATPPFRWALRRCPADLPRGCVVAIVELVAIYPVEDLIGDGRQMEFAGDFPINGELATQFPFGDFSPGRFIWHFKNIRPLPLCVPCRGHQRLWDWEA